MKLTKKELKQIIKEELEIVMENWDDQPPEAQAMRNRMLRNEMPPVEEPLETGETYGLTDKQLETLEMIGDMEGRAAVRRTARRWLQDEAAVEDLVNRFGGSF